MTLVEPLRTVVRVVHLQGHFARTALQRAAFYLCEEASPDSLALSLRQHGQVVNVERRLPREGRKSPHAHGDTDRLAFTDREQRERGGMFAQAGSQSVARLSRKRSVLTAGTARVGIDDRDESGAIPLVAEIGGANFDVHGHEGTTADATAPAGVRIERLNGSAN